MNLRSLPSSAALALCLAASPALWPAQAAAAGCTVKVGILLALSGSLGELGQDNARSAELAAQEVNAAGGVHGCKVEVALADTQTQPSVGVTAAKGLVDLKGVRAIVGANSSGTTMAVMRSVTVPSGVLLVSPTAASTEFTSLSKQGLTKGLFLRTIMSVKDEGPATAYVAAKLAKWKRISIVYVNNAFGRTYAETTERTFEAMGGRARIVPYNLNQPSYRAEVTSALQGNPQALVLIAYPTGGQSILKQWISAGGPRHFLLANSVDTQHFVDILGAKYLDGAWGVTLGAQTGQPGYKAFADAFAKHYGKPPSAPYDSNAYDAMAVTLLAMAASPPQAGGRTLAKAARAVTAGNGVAVGPGVAGYRAALKALAAGRPVHYVGATGALRIDALGDVKVPVVVSRVTAGRLIAAKTLGAHEVEALTSIAP
ncbi:MAG: ABC transporter substrate-binding protein [Acidihalobacter sp.]|uniref:ABC transporter substrate-binding protein n=1 Tax=Acidihalobacter sp. TaxID=1872108 RepID=UPI00307E4B80